MKKQMLLIIVFGLLLGCEDVIEVTLPTDRSRLVLDALQRITDTSQPTTVFQMRATLSSSFFGQIEPAILEEATITNEITSSSAVLQESEPGSGIYEVALDTRFLLEGALTLSIVHNGQRYSATTQYVPTVPIDSLIQGEGGLFGGDETEVIVSFTDAPNRDDFYLFDFDFNEYLVTEDEFYPGQRFEFSYFYDDGLETGREIEIDIVGVDKPFYDYMNQVIVQADGGAQGPFQTPAATVKGNFVNNDDALNFALGYFAVCQSYSRRLVIE
ncbi:MAG: DUF4249 family protein [Flavobacteriaceae bacterium]